MTTRTNRRRAIIDRRIQILLLVTALGLGAVFRLAYLASDPPWDFTWSQALFTDGARAIDGARSRIVFDTWILDPRSPVVLFYPLMNLLAFVIFKLAGVGLVQANLSGAIPALATLVLVYIGMRKVGGEVAASLAVFNLGFCYVHIVYSRVPMVESLEILMLLACFLLLLGGLGRRFLCGLLIGLAALMVKMHALHFLPVAVLFLWLERREDRAGGFLRSILAVAAGVVVAGLVWYLAATGLIHLL